MKKKTETVRNVDFLEAKSVSGFESGKVNLGKENGPCRSAGSAVTGSPGSPIATNDMLWSYRRTGDPRIAAVLFKQHWHLVVGICYKLLKDHDLSKDAAMDIFQRLLERLRIETPTSFVGWLYKVTRNHCIEMHRKQNRLPRLESLEEARYHSERDSIVTSGESQVVAMQVHKAMAALPENQRMCIEMFYFQELSYKEISDECGLSMMAVKSCIQNGKRRLAIALQSVHCAFYGDSEAI